MSLFDPSDFNGDGQTNYVDYQIYNQFIDPQSSQYQGNTFQQPSRTYYPRQKSGLTFTDYVILMAVYMVLFLIVLATPLKEEAEIAGFLITALWVGCIVLYLKLKNKKKPADNQNSDSDPQNKKNT